MKDAVTGVFEKISLFDLFCNKIPTTGGAFLVLFCSVFMYRNARSNKTVGML